MYNLKSKIRILIKEVVINISEINILIKAFLIILIKDIL
jgi:hypothetical protein